MNAKTCETSKTLDAKFCYSILQTLQNLNCKPTIRLIKKYLRKLANPGWRNLICETWKSAGILYLQNLLKPYLAKP